MKYPIAAVALCSVLGLLSLEQPGRKANAAKPAIKASAKPTPAAAHSGTHDKA